MTSSKLYTINYWATSNKHPLESILNKLEIKLKDFIVFDEYWNEIDVENVVEWTEINLTDGKKMNISRKHIDNLNNDELTILIDSNKPFKDEEIEIYGILFSEILKTKIFYGEIVYIGGDEYQYLTKKEFYS